MNFLNPLFFLGLAAIVVPVLVHLIQRERKHVVFFPSLMFVRKIPYQSVRRRKIRHWFLLLMRAAAIALIVAAFARPFFLQGAAAAAAAAGGNREVVIVLDQSASMGYGDRWERARTAARDAIAELGPGDRASLVLFGRNAEEHVRSTTDRGQLEAAIAAANVTSGATRYAFALQLADSILERSALPRREVILISDFQKSGWSGAEDVRFGENVTVTPVSVANEETANLSIPSVTFARAEMSGQERVTLTAGVTNRGPNPANGVAVTLDIDGHQVESVSVTAAPGASASAVFAPFTLAKTAIRGTVRVGSDPLPADNTFHFVLSPSEPLSVLLIDSGDRVASSFYLSKALAIGTAPAFQVEQVPPGRVAAAALERRAVVILNDTAVPPGVGTSGLRQFVERGGGLLVIFGDRGAWPPNETDLLPGQLGQPVDRTSGRGGTLGFLDYSHPVFEVFKAPRSGDFSAARVYRYRPLQTQPSDRVLARFDDGAVAMSERRVGMGRVIALSTALDDSWSDLALKPVYLPLVHQLVRYLARYEPSAPWLSVGQVVDVSNVLKGRAERVIVTPSSTQIKVAATEPGVLELGEQGVYEVRTVGGGVSPYQIAVNLDPAESDLTPLDTQELLAAVTGRADGENAPVQAAELTVEDAERQQGIWWYLLMAGLMLLVAEMAVSNRLSRTEKFL
jgi:hypothetical protein